MASNKQELFYHMQQYVRAVFADTLRREGFISYRNQDLAWYRIIDNEVLQTVYFFTRSTYIPAFAEIGFGCHPLYIEPLFTSQAYYHDVPHSDEILRKQHIFKLRNGIYSDAIRVNCPNDEYKGFDLLENILNDLEKVHTAKEAYQRHKARYETIGYLPSSMEFYDEVLFYGDSALYEACLEHMDFKIEGWRKYRTQTPKIVQTIQHMELQKKAMLTGERDEVLAVLQKKQNRVVKALRRNLGLVIVKAR